MIHFPDALYVLMDHHVYCISVCSLPVKVYCSDVLKNVGMRNCLQYIQSFIWPSREQVKQLQVHVNSCKSLLEWYRTIIQPYSKQWQYDILVLKNKKNQISVVCQCMLEKQSGRNSPAKKGTTLSIIQYYQPQLRQHIQGNGQNTNLV